MKKRFNASTPLRLTLTFALAVVFGGALSLTGIGLTAMLFPSEAVAGPDDDPEASRTYWQDQYRHLLRNRLTLEENIKKSTKDYAQAQRRNYPRGGARDQFRLDAEKSTAELEFTNQQIETLLEDAKRAGIPPGWLFEVEDESLEAYQPAAADTPVDDEDREGRNPLYLK